MDNMDLEILEYLVEYSDLLDDTTLEIAEKILFDANTDELDSLELEIYTSRLLPLLHPDCEGCEVSGCVGKGRIDLQDVLAAYQNGQLCCAECLSNAAIKQAS